MTIVKNLILFCCLTISLVIYGQTSAPLRQDIAQQLSRFNKGEIEVYGYPLFSIDDLTRLYHSFSFYPLWVWDETFDYQVEEAINLIAASHHEGLNPTDYHLPQLIALRKNITDSPNPFSKQQNRVAFEFLLTDGLLTYARHLYYGKVPQTQILTNWHTNDKPWEINFATFLLDAKLNFNLNKDFNALKPGNKAYTALKQGLAHYRQLAKSNFDLSDELFYNHEQSIEGIKNALVVNGDFDLTEQSSDWAMDSALIRFKNRHGLGESPLIDPITEQSLMISLDKRIETIKANLERWRWLPPDLGTDFLLINLPEFKLHVIKNDLKVTEHRVIIGKASRQTPAFSTFLIGININPTWTVPPTILKEDILPLKRGVPEYIRKNKLEVVDNSGNKVRVSDIDWQNVKYENFRYFLQQQPGPTNALGAIKFIMPNAYTVYIHDTPAKQLFTERTRAYSSGCIRVEYPFELAEKLFEGKVNRNTLDELRDKKKSAHLWFKSPIATYVLYFTCWVSDDNQVHFREDLYQLDEIIIKALNQPPIPQQLM